MLILSNANDIWNFSIGYKSDKQFKLMYVWDFTKSNT